MGYFLSRQRYFEENVLAVEIAVGGSKKAGPDVLVQRYNGEGKNLVSPIDAVNLCLSIFKSWDRENQNELKRIALVNHDGNGSKQYYDPLNKRDIARLERWAQDTFKGMTKCGSCAKPLGITGMEMNNIPGLLFCNEYCGSKKYRDVFGEEMPKDQKKIKKKISP